MQEFETIEARPLPEPGEVWRHRTGQHYLVVGHSVHAETQEVLVMLKTSTSPYTSVAYPVATFMGVLEADAFAPRFEKVGD